MENRKFALYFLFYFGLTYSLSIYFYNLGFFDYYDIFFNADVNMNIKSFTTGWDGRKALSHAFLEVFSVVTKALSTILSAIFPFFKKNDIQIYMALAICPATSTFGLYFIKKIINLIYAENKNTTLVILLYSLCFSTLLFSIIPESFILSNAAILYLIYLYTKDSENVKNPIKSNEKQWITASIIVTGITITNVFIFAIIYGSNLLINKKASLSKTLLVTLSKTFFTLFCVITFYYSFHYILDYNLGWEGSGEYITKFSRFEFLSIATNLANIGHASFASFVAFNYTTLKNKFSLEDSIILNNISFAHESSLSLGLALLLLYTLIIIRCFLNKNYTYIEKLKTPLSLIIAFNFALHSVFGKEMFLYSLHWFSSSFILISSLLISNRKALLITLFFVAISNFFFIFSLSSLISSSL
ncbi:hypothetical protein [Alteromonas portus]|uniref:hypothetical protein n=1 Tax=Alteromonas portus TaxID=2565549 RepID=UPI003BF7E3A4